MLMASQDKSSRSPSPPYRPYHHDTQQSHPSPLSYAYLFPSLLVVPALFVCVCVFVSGLCACVCVCVCVFFHFPKHLTVTEARGAFVPLSLFKASLLISSPNYHNQASPHML